MIAWLRGRLLARRPPWLTLDVQGVGYELEAPMNVFCELPEIGESVDLYTHLLVREDAQRLFGFTEQRQQYLFRHLIKVNGVGAKIALALLSGMTVDEFLECLRDHDLARLTRLPGIGKKTGERLILEMRGCLTGAERGLQSPAPGAEQRINGADPARDAVSALVALGYKTQDAERRVRAVTRANMADTADMADMDSAHIVRAALKSALR